MCGAVYAAQSCVGIATSAAPMRASRASVSVYVPSGPAASPSRVPATSWVSYSPADTLRSPIAYTG